MSQTQKAVHNIDIAGIESFVSKTLHSSAKLCLPHEDLNQLLEASKQLLETIEVLKLERRSYASILQNNKSVQQKLANHNNIIASIETSYNQRTKSMADEIKALKEQLQKQKKYYIEKYQGADKEMEDLKKERQQLKDTLRDMTDSLKNLKEREQTAQGLIREKQEAIENLTRLQKRQELGPMTKGTFENLFMSAMGVLVVGFLGPKEIGQLLGVNRETRAAIMKSQRCVRQIFNSIVKRNRQQSKALEGHVRYFDRTCEKISQDIIQTAFYKYMILKKNIGDYMLPILTDCAMMFEGKFVENLEVLPCVEDSLDELVSYSQFPVDKQIKQMYREQLVLQKEMISEEVYSMYKKIHNTAQLYSADVEGIGLFLNNLQNNYSKLFVFGKKLCTESKHLQMLNTYLLKEVTDRHHFQLVKNSEIEDLKAQLESESKIKNFFSSRSVNSQQQGLTLENEKLTLQMKLKELSKRFNDLETLRRSDEEQFAELDKKNHILIKDNKVFKHNFDQVHGKYTKIMQELEVLRDNLQKMSLAG